MPVDYGGMMGGFLNTNEQMQDMANKDLAYRMNTFKLQTEMKNQSILDASRAAMMQEAQKDMSGMGIPSSSAPPQAQPSPDSLAAKEAANGDMPATIGDTPPSNSGSPTSLVPNNATWKQSDLLMGEYNKFKRLATVSRSTGDNTSGLAYDKQAAAVLEKVATARGEDRKTEEQAWDNVQNSINGVTDGTTLNNTIKSLAQRYPGVYGFLDKMGMEKGPTGAYLWDGSKNPQIINAIGEQALNAKDRIARENKIVQEQQRQQTIDEKIQHDKEIEAAQRTNQIIAQNGQQLHADIAKQAMEDRRDRASVQTTIKIQRQLDSDPVYGNFSKYEQARDLSSQIVRQLSTPKGFENFNPSDARALGNTFANISENFRNRTGGKYAMQDQEKFNGLFQKYDKWVNSLGKGTPAFSESVSREMANTVTQLYDIANKGAVSVSLEGIERTSKLGGDPTAIKMKGDLQRLFQIGQAQQIEEKGKTYLVIGKKGETQHKFEMGDQ